MSAQPRKKVSRRQIILTVAPDPGDRMIDGMARPSRSPWHSWFGLTREERWLVAGILGLALLGLCARSIHRRQQTPEPVTAPAALELPTTGAQE